MHLDKVSDLDAGAILAKKIFTSDNKILLAKGTELNEKYIKKLMNLGIRHVYIEDVIEQSENTKADQLEIIPEKIKQEAVVVAKSCLNKISLDGFNSEAATEDTQEEISFLIENIINSIGTNEELLFNLKDVRMLEDELFFHLTNVTVFSLMIAKKLNYSDERLKLLGLGAFLHDIGKAKVPSEILNKPGKLTDKEFEEVKKHTTYGYEILKEHDDVPELSARIAYQHHERCNGSGYPRGLSKRYIDEFARIVAIADVFDAMVNDRVYRSGLNVKEVIEYLYTTFTQNELDRELVLEFLEIIAPYPIGTKVKLSIGCEAIVIDISKKNKLRPTVKILNFNGLKDAMEIDLSKKLNIDIVEIIH